VSIKSALEKLFLVLFYNISQNASNFLHIRITGFFGLFPSSSILENKKYNVSETGSVSVLK
jgi:hypothetical protein